MITIMVAVAIVSIFTAEEVVDHNHAEI